MSDTKILQAILDKVNSVEQEVKDTRRDLNKLDDKLTTRIDKLGLQIARLEDDAPTIDEFEKLVRRVTKLENKLLEN